MDLGGASGWNHVAGGVAAAIALPVGVFGLDLPFPLVVPVAGGIYLGLAFLLARPRPIDRIDPERVGRAQAALVAGLIEEGEKLVARLNEASRRLAAKDAANTAAHMAGIAQAILDRLAAEPGKLASVRRFLSYYLPRSVEIAEGLVVVEGQRARDPARVAGIHDMMTRLDQAFTFYSDSFAQAELDALDVELKLLGRSLAEDIGGAATPAPRRQNGAA
ncbi:MAG: 5-bromo-4-chloroindolyl phosphate hydrolysis family protein [Rhizobiales bacterium]|nr:5-bromo-4-chloroindolyl phosphate hydrolysis family protein [Hyphomicrobiales bacterium]